MLLQGFLMNLTQPVQSETISTLMLLGMLFHWVQYHFDLARGNLMT